MEPGKPDDAARPGRYARQIILPGFDREGQERLGRSRVLLLGAGGLGSVCAQYLVRAGVGSLVLVDNGKVDLPDLNRQLLYVTGDVGEPKARVAVRLLREINPEVRVEGIEEDICKAELPRLVADADVVVDALDNFPARMMVNEACCRYGKVLVHGGILGTRGTASVVVPGDGPCLQCMYEAYDLTPPALPLPVLGPTAGIVGSIQATETLHILLGARPALLGRLILFNGTSMNFSYRPVKRKLDCSVCRDVRSASGDSGGRKL
ncbi:MAG: HesA/MoeB/ThiF family protein [Pseudomonadota bacterium]